MSQNSTNFSRWFSFLTIFGFSKLQREKKQNIIHVDCVFYFQVIPTNLVDIRKLVIDLISFLFSNIIRIKCVEQATQPLNFGIWTILKISMRIKLANLCETKYWWQTVLLQIIFWFYLLQLIHMKRYHCLRSICTNFIARWTTVCTMCMWLISFSKVCVIVFLLKSYTNEVA